MEWTNSKTYLTPPPPLILHLRGGGDYICIIYRKVVKRLPNFEGKVSYRPHSALPPNWVFGRISEQVVSGVQSKQQAMLLKRRNGNKCVMLPRNHVRPPPAIGDSIHCKVCFPNSGSCNCFGVLYCGKLFCRRKMCFLLMFILLLLLLLFKTKRKNNWPNKLGKQIRENIKMSLL